MIVRADAGRLPFADGTFDLVFGSPPYCEARLYLEDGADLGIARGCLEWVDWMLGVTAECLRVCKGPVVWVASGVTRDRTYLPACEGLMWEWWRRGGSAYRPCYWHRVGIPGSGGDDWFRADVEYVMCFKRPGRLPWSDNTANGHPPRYAPGGEMSHRDANGSRRNQWGGTPASTGQRRANGRRRAHFRPGHEFGKTVTRPRPGMHPNGQDYNPPVLANPGNVVRTKVGGGHLGPKIVHDNEAPFPERLAEWFVASLCPPGGRVLDPFGGSGTTAAAALGLGRRAVVSDLRQSQCRLSRRRLRNVTPGFVFAD